MSQGRNPFLLGDQGASSQFIRIDAPLETVRQFCLKAVKALGWQASADPHSQNRLICKVPLPGRLSQLPTYSVGLSATTETQTLVVLMTYFDDVSKANAAKNLSQLRAMIEHFAGPLTNQTGPPAAQRSSAPPASQPARTARAVPPRKGCFFISYRRYDSADVAGRIYDRLAGAFGAEQVFKDVDDIPLGRDFRKVIDQAVSGCDVLLVVIGRDWLDVRNERGQRRIDDPADFVRLEIESALNREIPVIPLLVRDAMLPTADDLPGSLGELVYRNGILVRADPDFHRDMDRLIQALRELVGE